MDINIISVADRESIITLQSFIEDELQKYNSREVESATNHSICFSLHKEDAEKPLGGIVASAYLNLLIIESFWVHEDLRSLGYGTRLLNAVEKAAKEMGCYKSSLETYTFQSTRFYLNKGYQVVGSIAMKDYIKLFMAKDL